MSTFANDLLFKLFCGNGCRDCTDAVKVNSFLNQLQAFTGYLIVVDSIESVYNVTIAIDLKLTHDLLYD